MGIIGGIADAITGAIVNPQGTDGAVADALIPIDDRISALQRAVRGLLFAAEQEYGAVKWIDPVGEQIGSDLIGAASAHDTIVDHLIGRLIPRSLAHLNGYIFSKGVIPLRVAVGKAQSDIRFLMGWRGQIDTWRHDTVDPTLDDWRQFHHWFDQNAAPYITVLAGWLAKPATFAGWAVPVLGDPLIGWLANTASDASRDTVARVVVDSSPDVWRHVEAAAVAVLLQEQ